MEKVITETREEQKSINDKEKSVKCRWLNITHAFSQNAFGKNYIVESITVGNKSIAATCIYKFDRTPKVVNTYKKGMHSEKILKRLAFECSIYDVKYTVCYEDRFLGILETDVENFMSHGDIPYHRIR
jgi:hypothetical protein